MKKEDLDKIIGDRKGFDYDVNEMLVEELKILEKIALDYTTFMFYDALIKTPGVYEFNDANVELDENADSIQGYKANLLKMRETMAEFQKFMQSAYGKGLYEIEKIKAGIQTSRKADAATNHISNLFDFAWKYFAIIDKLENVCVNENDKREFLHKVTSLNQKLAAVIDKVVGYINASKDWSLGSSARFEFASMAFKEEINNMDIKFLNQSASEKIEPAKKVVIGISDSERERLNEIAKANALYDELCLDFMRDLEKQYAHSTKDMYRNFVDVKFKKFVERFNMPLSNNVSIGHARECQGQIKNLMDYISTISESSYTIGVYEKQ